MKSSTFRRLRAIAAKSPITLVHQVSKLSAGASFAFALAIFVAATTPPAASAQTVTYVGSGAVNFGTVNVCPSGKTTPAPCASTLTLTYNVTASGTLGSPQALTTGAPNLDYKVAGGTTCSGSVIQGNTCKVNVTFAPIAPGSRNGAVEIVDATGNVLATTYIYGIGAGSLAGFSPPASLTLGSGYNTPFDFPEGIAVDASGNVFVDDGTGNIKELLAVNGSLPPNPVIKVINGSGGGSVAIDGAGNLFSGATEIFAAGGYVTTRIIGTGIVSPGVAAVDGSGNVFIVDNGLEDESASVKEILAAGDYATTKTLGSGLQFPQYDSLTAIALDASGNVFVANPYDSHHAAITEYLAAGGYATVRQIDYGATVIAVDPIGNLFVDSNNSISELLAVDGVVPANPVVQLVPNSAGLPNGNTNGLALDSRGNLYVSYVVTITGYPGNTVLVQELRFSTPPTLNFSAIAVGHTSTDSPQSVQIVNKGNAALDFSALSVSPNWDLGAGSGTPPACAVSSSVLPAAACNLSVSFEPLEVGPLTGAVTFADNAFNATQSIPLTGTGLSGPEIVSLNWNYGAPYSVVILNGFNFGATQGSSTVTFNGIPTPHYYWADTQIYVTVPPNATTGNIVATVNGVASNPVPFTVLPMPVVTGISPTSGLNGTLVTISGRNLLDHGNRGTVTLNGKSLPLLSQSSTALQVTVPAGAVTGKFHVLVNDTGIDTATFTVPDDITFTGTGAVNFGNAFVCPSGKTTPAPCSKTQVLTYTVNANSTLGTPKALTTGQPNLDYTLASGTTCTGAVTAGHTCTVNVTFAPTAPGARNGAVEIVDTSGNVLATTYLSGIGVSPLPSFGQPANLTWSSGLVNVVAVAVDSSGDVFVADFDGPTGTQGIKELLAVNGSLPANPVVKVLPGSKGHSPIAVAVDGAGNVFFIDYMNDPTPVYVTEVLAAGGYVNTRIIGPGIAGVVDGGLAVDGSGNVFIVDAGTTTMSEIRVKEILAAGDYTTTKTLGAGFTFNFNPYSMAIDSSGNLFLINSGYTVYEFLAAGGYTTVRTLAITGPARSVVSSIALDPAGNLFASFSVPNGSSFAEFFAVNGVVPSNPQAVFFNSSLLNNPYGLAFDGRGNLYTGAGTIDQNGRDLQELQFSAPPPLDFGTVAVGDTSGNSPQSIQLQNRGNADLDLTAIAISSNWDRVAGSGDPADCPASFALVPSTQCNVSISFKPTETGALTGELTFTDNALNAPGSTQSAALTGTGVSGPPPPRITGASLTSGAIGTVVTLTGTNFGATQGSSTVAFSGMAASVTSWSNSSVVIAVPEVNTVGAYNVIVTVAAEASNPLVFTVTN